MSKKLLLIFKNVAVVFLFLMFLIYFCVPSWESFRERRTIFIETQRFYEQTDFPVISIGKQTKNMSLILQSCFCYDDAKREVKYILKLCLQV